MSQDVRVTELNEARQLEEILLLDDENYETNFKEALKAEPKVPDIDPEVSQQTSKEDKNPDLPASKEGSIPELPLSNEEELEDEDDKKEEKSDKESCRPDSIVSGDDSESEADDENDQGKKPVQNLNDVMWIMRMIKVRTERLKEKGTKTPMKTMVIKKVI